MKLIKSASTKRFKVCLYEAAAGYYYVTYTNADHDEKSSEVIKDLTMAAFMFDLKYDELEGH